MCKQINVVSIMDKIKQEVNTDKCSYRETNLMSPYYEKIMDEYRKQEQLVIFGSGLLGEQLYEYSQKEGISDLVKCFCDNNPSRQNTEYKSLPVLSPVEAVNQFPEAMYVITPRYYENEIVRQLVDMGISIHKISIVNVTGLGA